MKKAIIFDFWGTLAEQGVYSPIKQTRNILKVKMPYPEFVVKLEKSIMTQHFESITQAISRLAGEFSVELSNSQKETLIGIWNKNWLFAKLYDDTIPALKMLSKRSKLVLLSNTDCFSVQKVLEKTSISHFFNLIFLSCEEGHLKTDPQCYSKILKKLNLSEKDCLAVGDSIESDITAASQANVESVLIDRKDRRDYEPKILSLMELTKWN